MPQSYISLTEAATRKGVHYQTVRRAIARSHESARYCHTLLLAPGHALRQRQCLAAQANAIEHR